MFRFNKDGSFGGVRYFLGQGTPKYEGHLSIDSSYVHDVRELTGNKKEINNIINEAKEIESLNSSVLNRSEAVWRSIDLNDSINTLNFGEGYDEYKQSDHSAGWE